MYKNKKNCSISDERGFLYEFMNSRYNFQQVNILFSYEGTFRGNHYHKKITETFFILDGLVKVNLYHIKEDKKEDFLVNNGEEFIIRPYTLHTLEFLKDTNILSFYSVEFDPKDTDIFKLDEY